MADLKKVVLKLELRDEKNKKKALKAVSSLTGIDSISVDMKDQKLTITGVVDPITVVAKLRRKSGHAEVLSVGPAKEDKKKEEPKKEGDKEKEKSKEEKEKEQIAELLKAYQRYNPYMTPHYYAQSAEENPNACVVM